MKCCNNLIPDELSSVVSSTHGITLGCCEEKLFYVDMDPSSSHLKFEEKKDLRSTDTACQSFMPPDSVTRAAQQRDRVSELLG